MRSWICVTILLPFTFISSQAQREYPYQDPRRSPGKRVEDLLSRMTLEEKIAQLTSAMERTVNSSDPKSSLVDAKGAFQPERAAVLIKDGIGQISRPSGMRGPRQMAEFTNSIQKWTKENTRLGIPILFHEECLHGHAAAKGTSFPQAIALASTWDPKIVEDVFSATANEVRARGSHQCLTPVLDLARDPRWGRTEETYGEDPYLASRIGVAAVKGFQGAGPNIDRSHVIATAKHFAVHGQPEGGQGPRQAGRAGAPDREQEAHRDGEEDEQPDRRQPGGEQAGDGPGQLREAQGAPPGSGAQPSQNSRRSAGSGASSATGSRVSGWGSSSRQAWRAWRGRRRVYRSASVISRNMTAVVAALSLSIALAWVIVSPIMAWVSVNRFKARIRRLRAMPPALTTS